MPSSKVRKTPQLREPDLCDQLRAAIVASPHSARELARLAEVDPCQVHRFIALQKGLTLETAGFLCRALGLHLVSSKRPGRPKTTPKPSGIDSPGMFTPFEETVAGGGQRAREIDRGVELPSEPLDDFFEAQP
jgi:hypothetical protein